MLSKKNIYILRWLDSLKNHRGFLPHKKDKIDNNTYYLFFLLFKYLLFKDICNLHYTVLIQKYRLNFYLNFIECRFYYIFFFILLRNQMFDIIWFLFSDRVCYDKNITIFLNLPHTFFFNKYIFLSIYLLKYLNYFFLRYNKFKYYKTFRWYKNKYIEPYHNFFLFQEFKLKVDHSSFFLYRKYIDFFRFSKYNEYLANHIMFFKYPKLKYLLHIIFYRFRLFDGNYRLHTFLNYFNIYKLNNSKILNNNKYILNLKKRKYNSNCSLLLARSLNLNYILFLKLNNPFFYLKCINFDIYKFFNITNSNSNLTNLLLNFTFGLSSIYITYFCFHVYHIFISRQKRIRRLKCRHLVSLHWKFTKLNFKFLLPIFKIFYKYYTNNIINQYKLINFGFLSYYFLENNKFIYNNIKKIYFYIVLLVF